ncbi:MAG: haloalkane dehalogenase [Anaerolineae bacterium]|nr:haloalkane dehalogenase [Anaerolineae bacterium]
MPLLRTPDERFANLPGWPFSPHYVDINGARVHYVDEGQGDVILCLHGEPSWSYLYRKMLPGLSPQYRAVAFDWIGFGRSDKYTELGDYSFQMHRDTLVAFIEKLDLHGITLVCQDWGGIIGLSVATELAERFARLVIMNTGLPTGDRPMGEGFMQWRAFAERTGRDLEPGKLIGISSVHTPPDAVLAAYDAPFPDASYRAGVAAFPMLIPLNLDDPGAADMRRTREALSQWDKPALVMFSDSDPVTGGADRFFRKLIPSAKEQPVITIQGAGHFLQEEKGEAIAAHILDFLARTIQ